MADDGSVGGRGAPIIKLVNQLIVDASKALTEFHVFSKFVKLPPVDTSKVTQIIQYEAQQNVPFPLEEVVWDYQILGTTPSGELEVLLVAIKSDVVAPRLAANPLPAFRFALCPLPLAGHRSRPPFTVSAFQFSAFDFAPFPISLAAQAQAP